MARAPDRPPKTWPKDATRAAGRVKRLAPALRTIGIEVDDSRRGPKPKRQRLLHLTTSEGRRNAASPSVPPGLIQPLTSGNEGDTSRGPSVPPASPLSPSASPLGDQGGRYDPPGGRWGDASDTTQRPPSKPPLTCDNVTRNPRGTLGDATKRLPSDDATSCACPNGPWGEHRLRRKAGVDRRITPHSLRRSFATIALQAGVAIEVVQFDMDHESSRTTAVYNRLGVEKHARASNTVAALLASAS